MTNYLTTKKAAEKTGFAEQTLANKRSKGEGPPYVKVGRAIRYPEKSLDKWFKAQTVVPQPKGQTAPLEQPDSGEAGR